MRAGPSPDCPVLLRVQVTLAYEDEGGREATATWDIRLVCRAASAAFKLTFVDVDGSVHYSACSPRTAPCFSHTPPHMLTCAAALAFDADSDGASTAARMPSGRLWRPGLAARRGRRSVVRGVDVGLRSAGHGLGTVQDPPKRSSRAALDLTPAAAVMPPAATAAVPDRPHALVDTAHRIRPFFLGQHVAHKTDLASPNPPLPPAPPPGHPAPFLSVLVARGYDWHGVSRLNVETALSTLAAFAPASVNRDKVFASGACPLRRPDIHAHPHRT